MTTNGMTIDEAMELAARIADPEDGCVEEMMEFGADVCGVLHREALQLRADLARVTAERDELRAIVEGRATPPTAAEIEAHKTARGEWLHSYPLGRVGGRWTFTVDLCAAPAGAVAYNGAELAEGEIVEVRDDGEGNDYYFPLHPDAHWWPLDANECPCAWPKVTP